MNESEARAAEAAWEKEYRRLIRMGYPDKGAKMLADKAEAVFLAGKGKAPK